ncbi:calpain-2 catalytic subunit-like [Hoplias malabaricus]|uniref:calpain-2 catalytic subunit-like n=1 Tax=Hoplias malabaricus TaxID=27720 RepID=UPI0034620A35
MRVKASVKYLGQDFEELRRQCLRSGQLFCDPTFPESLGFNELGPNSANAREVQWKRPKELCPNPHFIVGGTTTTDICQGDFGDCWLMAAIASLTLNQDILAHVIYPDQNFTNDYAGIFRFQLWQYVQWVDVVIDDLLPTKNSQLLFVHSAERNEFWSALLEKAYAKVNCSYESLKRGRSAEGFEDFTGGIVEHYYLSQAPLSLFNVIKQALGRGSLLSTSIHGTAHETEVVTQEQLVKRHAYSIIGAEEIQVGGDRVQLLHLRNPWGYKQWTGALSDKSREWNQVLPQVKAKLLRCADEGEFWMAYSDFKQWYAVVEICNLIPDSLSSGRLGLWDLWQFEATFKSNQQFVINLDSSRQRDMYSSILVGLMKKDVHKNKPYGQDLNNICFSIYPVPKEYKSRRSIRLSSETLSQMRPAFRSVSSVRREVCQRCELLPGVYVIISSTNDPHHKGSFLLRVFSEK